MHLLIQRLLAALAWLVLPLAILLLVQWPLRDWLQAYPRQANDAAQIVFALLASVAVTAASQAGVHLSATPLRGETTGWRPWALALCVVPWALFMLWASGESVWQSVTQAEKFAETLTPGFFLIKLSMLALYVLVLVQAIAFAFWPKERSV